MMKSVTPGSSATPDHLRKRGEMVGFVSAGPLSTFTRLALFPPRVMPQKKASYYAIPRSRSSQVRMCANNEEEADEEVMQGPSQAPTKSGVSTANLSESDAKFIEACYKPDPDVIEKMIDDGIDPNIADVNGRTALHFCAGNGLPTVCRKLLDAGADINKQDVMGFTPLHMAAGYKKIDTVRFLVEQKADANIATYQGKLPVEVAENMLEKTPKKRFFVPNADHSRLKEIVDVLDEATEEEEEEEEPDESATEAEESTEEEGSTKFVVRVKPKGEAAATPPPPKVDDVKVTIRIKEPEPKK